MTYRPASYLRGVAALRSEPLDITDTRWVGFVKGHPQATAFHLPTWCSLVAECYGFRAFALALLDSSGCVVGGVPVVEVRQPFGRRKWVALPFTDYCPALFAGTASHLESAFVRAVPCELARHGARRLEIRGGLAGADSADVAVRHVLDLRGDLGDVYSRFHRSQVQRNIRRAQREGVTVRTATRETDLTEVFYRLHLLTRRRQGVPVQPRRFFALAWRRALAAGHGSVLIAEHRGVPVAAAVFLRHNGMVIYKYGASDASAWSLRPNHALFWHAIRTASSEGVSLLDWGRTDLDNAGLRAFKTAWGAVETPLAYTTISVDGVPAAPGRDLAASAPAKLAATLIQRSPTWVCSALGEALYRYTA